MPFELSWIPGGSIRFLSNLGGLEALAGLIPIQLHLKKLVKWSCLWTTTLPSQHALMSLLSVSESSPNSDATSITRGSRLSFDENVSQQGPNLTTTGLEPSSIDGRVRVFCSH